MSFFRSAKSKAPSLSSSKVKGLRLYNMKYCYFCSLVRDTAAELGIHLELIDVPQNQEARNHLIDKLGRSTVPVLSIPSDKGERLLPESSDIIHYLKGLEA